ncbi:helix-turn-helix domain-containing protein [Arcanobacterium haemolyticum]|nr:helix-turn-helix domain-containing protein [Arcanobacterium haemolyticum]
MSAPQTLGTLVRNRRLNLGISTSRELAEMVRVSARLIGDIENGRRSSYSANTLVRLDNALQWEPGSSSDILNGRKNAPEEAHSMFIDAVCDNTVGNAEIYAAASVGSDFLRKAASGDAVDAQSQIPSQLRAILVSYFLGFDPREFDLLTGRENEFLLSTTADVFGAIAFSKQAQHPEYYERLADKPQWPNEPEDSLSITPESYDAAHELARQIAADPDGYALAARQHEPDPYEGLGEENQDVDR